MTPAVPRSSRAGETTRSRSGPRPRLYAAAVVLTAGLTCAAISLLPRGDTAGGLLQRLPITVAVALATTVLAAALGLSFAPLAAYRGTGLDRFLNFVVLGGHVVPTIWVSLALSTALMTSPTSLVSVGYVPVTESVSGWLVSLALPLAALTLGSGAALTRQLAQSGGGLLQSELVRTLLSRGLGAGYVFRHHVLPQAALPGVTLLVLHFLGLLIGILAMDAVAVHALDPVALTPPSAEPHSVLVSAALVIVLTGVGYLARRSLVGLRQARGVKL